MKLNKNFLVAFLFLIILSFSLAIRLFRISEPKHYYFDEVYHVVTARAYAQNNKAAYNPFSPPPEEGTAYDWLHPPLAKLFQAASIKLVGDNPLGWRLPSAIFGTGIIAATFVLAFILFGPYTAIFASLIISFENLNLTMSRITMNDVFVTFFALVAFIFAALFVKRGKNIFILFTAIFLGLAWASKWTGLYAILGVLLYLIITTFRRKIFNPYYLLLFIVPPLIYVVSYGQFWLMGYKISDFVNLHKQIWWYQRRGDLKHSYATTPIFCAPEGLSGPKQFCPWALDVRPVYFSYEQYGSPRGEAGEKAGYIYNLGNPLVFWMGIIGVSFLIGKFLEERKSEYLLILVGYFIFWLPWVFTPRILFFHHYLPSIPFMAIALGSGLSLIFKTKFWIVPIVVIAMFAIAFFYFYPISSGYPIPINDISRTICVGDNICVPKYMWLSTWR